MSGEGAFQQATGRVRRAGAVAVLLLLAACGPGELASDAPPREPEDAVRQLVGDLRRGDLAAYARHAVPPELHDQLDTAWRDGRTLWPLTELPLHEQMPGFLASLTAPGAEKRLLADYRRQFAGAHAELRAAATTLGVFATRYVAASPHYSPDERAHYIRLIGALSAWGQQAPLGDPARAREAIPKLVAGARLTGLDDPQAFRERGMADTLHRLQPFVVRLKAVLAAHYGLDVDAALDSVQTQLLERDGDHARVRVRYQVAGQPVEGTVQVERHNGRWLLTDVLRHASTEAGRPPTPVAAAADRAASP